MYSPAKYRQLAQLCERRKSVGERRLLQLRRERHAIDAERERLQRKIDLLVETGRVDRLDGKIAGRGELFDWLRKDASLRHRTQMLRFDLGQSDERASECDRRIDGQREICRVLEEKRERYTDARRRANARLLRIQMNLEESELEERKSWST
ncbi:hypothetical protein ACGTRS_31725 [Burkholderia semiarida]|uniref:Flagellar FliJ protein n=1 Tax=Burkholderia semiarida TaxID=2843303 RepID=A0ABW7LCL6_9BURK